LTTAGKAKAGCALAIFALSIASLFIWVSAAAAAPANDAFASATALPEFPGEQSGSNLEATKETGEPNHAGNPGGHSVWYSWTPSSDRRVGIQNGNCFGGTDILIAVYTGSSVDALTPVASNQSPTAPACFFSELPQAEFEATAGTTYWIAVDGRDGAQGSFNLRINGQPDNDDFANPTTVGATSPQNVFATTKLASREAAELDHAGDPGGHSVWFSWTPTTSEPVRIATCTSSSSLDAVLSVYTGSQLDSLTEVASNDESPVYLGFGGCRSTDSAVMVNAVAGTTYRIAVDGANGTAGRFNLLIEGRPANDDFDSARYLGSTLPAFDSGASNEAATKETGEPDHAGAPGGQSVWFEWIAPTSGRVRIATCSHEGLDLDTVLGVYTGSSLGGLTQVASNDDGPRAWCRDHNSELELTVVSGTSYTIAVDTKGDSQGRFGLSIEAPGANDDFADPRVLPDSLNLSIGHSNALASKETGEPNHAAQPGGASVWFSWTAPSSGPVSISACPYLEEAPDTLLAVYTGTSLASLVPVAASDDSPSACQEAGSEVSFDAVAGTNYRIAVDSKDHSDGLFTLELGGRPANDDFSANHDLGPGPFSTGGSTRFASKESGEPDHAGDPGGHSVWFNWTATETGPVDLYACGRQPGVDTLLAVYTGGALGSLASVAANDDVPRIPQNELCKQADGNSEVVFTATAGTTYWIAVDTKDSEGRYVLELEEAPQNDDLANAKELFAGLPTFGSAFTKLAGKESGEPNHAGDAGGHSVWFKWKAPATGAVAFQTCTFEPGFDTVLGVYTGAGLGGLTPVAGGDDGQGRKGCRSTDSVAQFSATAGTTYLIAVDGKAGNTGSFQLIAEGVQVNDDFGKAQPLGGGLPTQSEGSNRFAGEQAGEPDHAGDSGGSSVWFKWTAPRSGTVSVDACDSDFDTLLAVYTGATLGTLAPVQGNDDGSGSCAPGSHLSFEAVANTTYRIALDGKAGAEGTFGLYLEGRAENDDFEDAAVIPGRPGWYWPGSTMLAGKQTGEPDHGGDAGGHSVWFSWTPRKSWMIELDVCAEGFEPLIGVYTGSAVDGLTPVSVSDAGSGECEAGRSVGFTTEPGTTYSFAVDGSGGDRGHLLLHLRGVGVLPHTLSVTRAGAGAGTVDSSAAGLDCGAICSHDFEEGAAVVLVANPAPGSTFAGWSGGGCLGTGRCQLAVNSDINVTATFEGQPTEGGGGTVPPVINPPTAAPPAATPPKKPLKCKRGFKKKVVKGKPRCVKKKKKKNKKRRHR
jgi:Divergent InlB B-repeat domain